MHDTWRVLAFCGRYAHQPLSELMRLTTRDLGRLTEHTADLLKDERPLNPES